MPSIPDSTAASTRTDSSQPQSNPSEHSVARFFPDLFTSAEYDQTPYDVDTLLHVVLDSLPHGYGTPLAPATIRDLVYKQTGISFSPHVVRLAGELIHRNEDYPYYSNLKVLLYLINAHGHSIAVADNERPAVTDYPTHPAFDETAGSWKTKTIVAYHLARRRTLSSVIHYGKRILSLARKPVPSRSSPVERTE